MNLNRLFAAALAPIVACVGLGIPALAEETAPLSTRFDPAKHWKSSDLAAGMKGYGLTVFQGTAIERFNIEVLGVIKNSYTDIDLVVVRCSGGPLRKTGVIRGMSGSPIYVDDKLVGALAYAWSFSKDSIAGITPIEDMLPVLDFPATERGGEAVETASVGGKSGPATLSAGVGSTQSTPMDWASRFQAFLRKDHSGFVSDPAQQEISTAGHDSLPSLSWETIGRFAPLGNLERPLEIQESPGWIPLGMPITATGVSGRVLSKSLDLLSPIGLLPMPGGPPAAFEGEKVDLEPGSAVGVSMVHGDLEMAGIGTVTYRDGNRILGFGHPMFQDGATDLPLTNAYITTVLPSLMISSKMGGPIEIVGALEQDRLTAIGGNVGVVASTLPLRIAVKNESTGMERVFNYDLAYHRFYTARFALMCVLDAIDVTARGFRDSTADYTLTLNLKNRESVVLRDQVSSSGGVAFDLAMTLGNAIDILLRNPYEKVDLESVELDLRTIDRLRKGTIEWIGVDDRSVEAGDRLVVQVAIQNWLGGLEVLRHEIELPEETPPGYVELTVSDAWQQLAQKVKRNPDRYRTRDLRELLDLLKEFYRGDDLFFTVASISPGASVFGVEMPDLPTSVLRVMTDSGTRGTGVVLSTKVLVESDRRLDRPVSGTQKMLVEVVKRKADRID